MSLYDFLPKAPQGALAATKRSVYMALPFVDFKRVLEAQRFKTRLQFRQWVIRSVLRQFESHVRMLERRSNSERVVGPEELYSADDGRIMGDLEGVLRRYQLAESDIPVAAELVRLKLQLKYLVGEVEA